MKVEIHHRPDFSIGLKVWRKFARTRDRQRGRRPEGQDTCAEPRPQVMLTTFCLSLFFFNRSVVISHTSPLLMQSGCRGAPRRSVQMAAAPQPRQADHLTPPKRHFLLFFFKSLSSTSQKQPSLKERRAQRDVGGLAGLGEGGLWEGEGRRMPQRGRQKFGSAAHICLPDSWTRLPQPRRSTEHPAFHTPVSILPSSLCLALHQRRSGSQPPHPRHRRRAPPACEWECDGMRRKSRAALRLQARDRSTGGASPCRSFSLLHFRLTHFLPAPSPPS